MADAPDQPVFPVFQRLVVHPVPQEPSAVWEVELNRAAKHNALDETFWTELPLAFAYLHSLPQCRCILLTADGSTFCAGIDLLYASSSLALPDEKNEKDVARTGLEIKKFVQHLQQAITSIEECSKPVIACIQGGCLGAGLAMITACDIRLCTEDAYFSVKEVDIGLAADLGTLQRLPKTVRNDSWVREISYTCRNVPANEALKEGLVSAVVPDFPALKEKARCIARTIASKSPVAVMGTKHALNYSRDHTTQEGLNMQAIWNAAMLQTKDIEDAAAARSDRYAVAHFSNL